jgi:hypothetical protein
VGAVVTHRPQEPLGAAAGSSEPPCRVGLGPLRPASATQESVMCGSNTIALSATVAPAWAGGRSSAVLGDMWLLR